MKRFLAIILALAMILCLAACSDSQQPDETGKPDNDDPKNPIDVLTNFSVGVSIADVDALVALLRGQDPGLDIENVYFEIGASGDRGLISLGAKLLGEQHDAKLFLSKNDVVLSAPTLLDQNYGTTMENLMAMMGSMGGSFLPMNRYAGSATSVAGILTSLNPEVLANLLGKYYNMLISELKKSGDVEVTSEGGKSVINGTLSADAMATIFVELLEELCKDDEFFELVGPLTGTTAEEFKENFLSEKPDKDTLLAMFKEAWNQYQVSLKIKDLKLTADNIPVAGDLYLSANMNTQGSDRLLSASLAFDIDKGFLNLSVVYMDTEMIGLDIGDGKLDARVNIEGTNAHLTMEATDNSLKGSLEVNGEKVIELEMTVSDTELNARLVAQGTEFVLNVQITESEITGTLTVDGTQMGKATFEKKVKGSKTTLTLKTLELPNVSMDFSEVGLCFYIDTNPSIPAAPTYTDVSTLSQEELQDILQRFMTDNADLVEWISSLGGHTAVGPAIDTRG